MKNIKYLLYSVLTFVSFSINAQEETTEEEPTFSVAGSIDTYFRSADYAPGHRLQINRVLHLVWQMLYFPMKEKNQVL